MCVRERELRKRAECKLTYMNILIFVGAQVHDSAVIQQVKALLSSDFVKPISEKARVTRWYVVVVWCGEG